MLATIAVAAFSLPLVPASASTAAVRPVAAAAANPRSPGYRHDYRQGVIPAIGRLRQMNAWTAAHPEVRASSRNLSYGGGIDGIGVTTGQEKVYLVFFGSQWGTQGTGGNSDVTLTGDPSGEAPYLQQLFKGLGTGGDT